MDGMGYDSPVTIPIPLDPPVVPTCLSSWSLLEGGRLLAQMQVAAGSPPIRPSSKQPCWRGSHRPGCMYHVGGVSPLSWRAPVPRSACFANAAHRPIQRASLNNHCNHIWAGAKRCATMLWTPSKKGLVGARDKRFCRAISLKPSTRRVYL